MATATTTTTPVASQALVSAVTDALALVKTHTDYLNRARVLRAHTLVRLADDMGGWKTRGVQSAMSTALGIKRPTLAKYMAEAQKIETATGRALRGLTIPTTDDGAADVTSADWDVRMLADGETPAKKQTPLALFTLAIAALYRADADGKKEVRKEVKKEAAPKEEGDSTEEEGAGAPSEDVPTLEDVTRAAAQYVAVLERFTAGAGLTGAQASAVRAIVSKGEALILAATV